MSETSCPLPPTPTSLPTPTSPPVPGPLSGRTALVTGVSRRRGIGFGVACALADLGASVFLHHYAPHDRAQPWGGDDIDCLVEELRTHLAPGAQLGHRHADLSDAETIGPLLEEASALTGSLEVLVCNQARSGSDGSILDMDAARLDAHWDVNARATLLLTADFARRVAGSRTRPALPGEAIGSGAHWRHPGEPARPRAKVFWMTSGQVHSPMRGEVAYATSKAALAGVTPTVAAELLGLGIVLNTINPGPVNTGYLDPDTTDRGEERVQELLAATPFGRFGEPADPAHLISWLATDAGSWVVGQVLTSDGGFSLSAS